MLTLSDTLYIIGGIGAIGTLIIILFNRMSLKNRQSLRDIRYVPPPPPITYIHPSRSYPYISCRNLKPGYTYCDESYGTFKVIGNYSATGDCRRIIYRMDGEIFRRDMLITNSNYGVYQVSSSFKFGRK